MCIRDRGWTYDGPYDDLPAAQEPGGHTELPHEVTQSAREAHRVILWDEVGEEEGTGIVHIAVSYTHLDVYKRQEPRPGR